MARCAHSQVFVSSNAVCEQMIPARHALQHTATCHTPYNTHRYMSHTLQHTPLHVTRPTTYAATCQLPGTVVITCHCYLLQLPLSLLPVIATSLYDMSVNCHRLTVTSLHNLSPIYYCYNSQLPVTTRVNVTSKLTVTATCQHYTSLLNITAIC